APRRAIASGAGRAGAAASLHPRGPGPRPDDRRRDPDQGCPRPESPRPDHRSLLPPRPAAAAVRAEHDPLLPAALSDGPPGRDRGRAVRSGAGGGRSRGTRKGSPVPYGGTLMSLATAVPSFDWKRWPETEQLVNGWIASALEGNDFAANLAKRMR